MVCAQTKEPCNEGFKIKDKETLGQAIAAHKKWLAVTGIAAGINTFQSDMDMDAAGASQVTVPQPVLVVGNDEFPVAGGRILADACNDAAEKLPEKGHESLPEGACRFSLVRAELTAITSVNEEIANAFSGQDLRCAVFTGSLTGVHLSKADLRGADFWPKGQVATTSLVDAKLDSARLMGSNMTGVTLTGGNLNDADLRGARLTNATLRDASLERTMADGADFAGAFFQPKAMNGLSVIGASGLSEIRFSRPEKAVALRKVLKESSLSSEERALSAALRQYQLSHEARPRRYFEEWILGGKLTGFGTRPGDSLVFMFVLVPFFAILYLSAILVEGKGRIEVMLPRVRHGIEEKRCIRVRPGFPFLNTANDAGLKGRAKIVSKVLRCLRLYAIALHFSLLTAFQLGWKELTVGDWMARLQSRNYTFGSKGWVRVISGLQTLVSVYLIALWALTYFKNPFE